MFFEVWVSPPVEYVVFVECSLSQFFILPAYEGGRKGSFSISRLYTILFVSCELVSLVGIVFGGVVPACMAKSMVSGVFSLGIGVVW